MNGSIRARIHALHRQVLWLDRLRSIAGVVMLSTGCLLAAVGVDWLVRWPAPVRLLVLAVGMVVLIRCVRRMVLRCWWHAPSPTSTALRIEQVEPALHGTLASAMEFESRPTRAGLESVVIGHVAGQLRETRIERHVRRGPAAWALLGGMLALLGVAAWIRLEPSGSIVGLRRTLTPWTSDRWMPRVQIESEGVARAVARGSQVPLRVTVRRGDTEDLRVRARCITRQAGRAVGEREMDLVRQPDGAFERPILAEGDGMTVEFIAGDGSVGPFDVRVVTAPSIASGSLEIRPPAYATDARPTITSAWKGTRAQAPGVVLDGSTLRLQLQLDAPATRPRMGESVQARDRSGDALPGCAVEASTPTTWNIETTLREGAWIAAEPIDALGVEALEPFRLDLEVIQDSAPSVSVTEPEADEIVTTMAQVPFQVQARDDVALGRIGWTLDRQQRSGEPAPRSLRSDARDVSGGDAQVTGSIAVSELDAKSGDTLLLRGVASDRRPSPEGAPPVIASEPRRIRIVDQDVLERQLRQQAGGLRQVLSRLENTQREIMQEADPASRTQSQSALSERIRQASDTMDDLIRRMRRNAMQDTPLSETLSEGRQAVSQAIEHSRQAQEEARQAQSGDPAAQARLRQAQSQVTERLTQAIDALDRDDDAASMQRRADRLGETIDRLRRSLQQVAKSSTGKTGDELGSEERRALQEQANQQRAAAGEAAAMIEALRDRADRVRSKDASQSRSLQQAAEEGEKGQAARRLDEAAERTDRNQTAAADEAMQRAAEAVERVRESLRQDRRARTEDLRRRLSSLSETLRALIAAAETTLTRIDVAAGGEKTDLSPVLSETLRISTNTAAAAEESRRADRNLANIASTMLRASERFEAAAAALKDPGIDFVASRGAMNRGIELLREAQRKVSEEQAKQDKASAERERAQLSKQYRELATRTRACREAVVATVPAAGARVDRRGAAVQREQAAVLEGIAQALRAGPAAAELVSKVESFTVVHERVDRDLGVAKRSLSEAIGGPADVRRIDLSADALEGLALALADPEPGEEPFMDAQQQQAGGSGGGSGAQEQGKLPPLTELRVVRQMQAQVNRLTRILDESRAAGQPVDRELEDLARMQDDVRRLGESWFERMRAQKGKSGGDRPKDDAPVDVTPGFFHDEPPVTANGASTTPPSSVTTPEAPPPAPRTLDELLGIESGSRAGEATTRRRDRKLDRALKEADLDDLADAAAESISLVDSLIGERKDIGIDTQRAQTEALANLDALIDAATRFQRQQQTSSSSSSASSSRSEGSRQESKAGPSKQGATEQASASTQKRSDGARDQSGRDAGDSAEPPPPEDAALAGGALEEGRSEWGALPTRVREIMSQARRDRVSALYQEATEAYYRRLAERRNP